MKYAAIQTLLSVVGQCDARQLAATPEDRAAKATAWESLLDPAMTFEWARTDVVRHYRASDEVMTPALLNGAWAKHRAHERAEFLQQDEAHCGRTDCTCTHSGGCFKGWIDSDDGPTSPCGRCRPWTARRVQAAPPPGKRNDADLYRLSGAGVDRDDVDMSPVIRG